MSPTPIQPHHPSGANETGHGTHDSWRAIGRDSKDSVVRTLGPVLLVLAAMWAIHVLNALGGGWLSSLLALDPRSLSGLPGILAMPLLHLSWGHLVGNSISWLMLGSMTAILTRRFVAVTAAIWLLGGTLFWIGGFGPAVGASGVIYGFASFLIVYGWAKRRPIAILFAVVVAFLHGIPMILGMLPFINSGTSWDGHLWGAVAGVVVALWFTREVRAKRQVRKAERTLGRVERRGR